MIEYAYLLFVTVIAASMLSTSALQLVLAWIMIRGNLAQKSSDMCQIEDRPNGPSKAMRDKLLQPADLISPTSFKDTLPVQGFGESK